LPEKPNIDLIVLGQALFFDRELSGNRDIACATCHHPLLATGDALSLPIGAGAVVPGALGPFREKGADREFVPRNAPEIFNRGSILWFSQFWDSRVVENGRRGYDSPAGKDLPRGLPNVLAVQAMFPVTSRDEMRGSTSDNNELAAIQDSDFRGIWQALTNRLLAIPEYRMLFRDAYGIKDKHLDKKIGFEHAATAIAAFEIEAFTFLDSPFDRYLSGDDHALTTPQKRGALSFYGKAKCSQCHSGALLTDQQHYNLLVPHLGPGKVASSVPPIDPGRALVTLDPEDAFRFRTPPLRHVTATGPYMHNGAYADLEEAVRHHLDTTAAFATYDPAAHIDQIELVDTVVHEDVATSIPGDLAPPQVPLTRREFNELMSFLKALTAPRLSERLQATIPDSVPSGLPVDGT
jgi:cytochrome c peroxidase